MSFSALILAQLSKETYAKITTLKLDFILEELELLTRFERIKFDNVVKATF